MDKYILKQIIIDQQNELKVPENLISRDINIDNYINGYEAIVISGIRRCGKSTLLKIFAENYTGKDNYQKTYVNFNDIRLNDFVLGDFIDLENLIKEIYGINKKYVFFIDEIQNVKNWHQWINNLVDRKIKTFITGSNSRLLSSEISTYLTGRNKVIQLFPFNFKEFLSSRNFKINNLQLLTTNQKIEILNVFREYLVLGGMPQVILNNDILISKQIFEDILLKDIVVRKQIREIAEFKDLVLYLISNTSSIYSYSTLKTITGIKSLSTIKNYIDGLKETYLMYTLNRFSYSIKKQKVSSSKIYCQDNIFLKTIAFNFSKNKGQLLENLVFIELLRRGYSCFYHKEKKECDFIIKIGNNIEQAIQVSLSIEREETKTREINGLKEAMNLYGLKKGLILTENEEFNIKENDYHIIIKPIWKWLLKK